MAAVLHVHRQHRDVHRQDGRAHRQDVPRLGDREDLNKKVLEEMELTRKWVLDIVGDKWPLQHRLVLGQAIRIRSPYVDALSVTQVLALKSLRKKVDKEELSQSQQAGFIYLILCTVSGVAAGLQNTG